MSQHPRSTRDASIDALKGLAIALVVLGHALVISATSSHPFPGAVSLNPGEWVPVSTASSLLLSFVYSFHMPLFAFVSGRLLDSSLSRPMGEVIRRRAMSLLLPYMAWVPVLFAVDRFILRRASGSLWTALVSAALGRSGLWFLFALFVCSVVAVAIAKVSRRWLLPLSAVVAIGLSAHSIVPLPNLFHLSNVVWIYPFVVMGLYARDSEEWLKQHRALALTISLVAFGALLYLRHPVHVPAMQPLRDVSPALLAKALALAVRYACAAAGVAALYAGYTRRTGRWIDAQAFIGKRSLGIYATHSAFVWALVEVGLKQPLLITGLALAGSLVVTVGLERFRLTRAVLLGAGSIR
ncbi:MAG TPA: acyltransferase [Coriobacteriia bacterium]|nr:acyltransferase [Coriobacteriia bacterium]